MFCPNSRWGKEWVERLQKRYDKTGLAKDYKALLNAKDRYRDNIIELVNCGLPVYQPDYLDYDLWNYVRKMRDDWCIR